MIAPQVDVERRRGDGAGMVGRGEGGDVAHVVERGVSAKQGRRHQRLDERVTALEVGWDGVDHAAGEQRDDTGPMAAELARELFAQRLHGGQGDLEPADVVVADRVALAAVASSRANARAPAPPTLPPPP
jgi:hypothetical protein